MSQLKRSERLQIKLEVIKEATNFKDRIGKGGYGNVYKGQLNISGKSTTVAVKRLNKELGQGSKEFLTEIQLLSCLKHPNLICLVGYCDEGKEHIIVYEYAEHGSLDTHLRGSNTTPLTWLERLKICVGAARGLDYLHNHVGEHAIIHRDIKSANILIDGNWVAKVSDIGLSKLTLAGISDVISNACGTPAYCDPEYVKTTIVKKQSDVYSFGLVLFEVLCGSLCNIQSEDGFLLTCSLAKAYYEQKRLDEIVDPDIKGEMKLDSMNKFAAVAYGCLHDDRDKRPTMAHVVKELEESFKHQVYHNSRYYEMKFRNLVATWLIAVLVAWVLLHFLHWDKISRYLEPELFNFEREFVVYCKFRWGLPTTIIIITTFHFCLSSLIAYMISKLVWIRAKYR